MKKNTTKKLKYDPDEFRPGDLASSWHENLLSGVMRVPDDDQFEAPVDINGPFLVWLLTVSFMAGADVALAGATAPIADCKGTKEIHDEQCRAAMQAYDVWLKKAAESLKVEIEAGNYSYPAKHRRPLRRIPTPAAGS
jgi:hypothetical protein